MTERPIIFSAPMVRALLAGTKTQTRRIMKPQPPTCWVPFAYGEVHKMQSGVPNPDKVIGWGPCNEDGDEAYPLRFVPGDHLWVRETVRAEELKDGRDGVRYLADDAWRPIKNSLDAAMSWAELAGYRGDWRKDPKVVPAIHMPRWASRITLLVTDVRVERLQAITEDDVMAEGCPPDREHRPIIYRRPKHDRDIDAGPSVAYPREWFELLWNKLNGPGAWETNPWVVAVSFSVEKGTK